MPASSFTNSFRSLTGVPAAIGLFVGLNVADERVATSWPAVQRTGCCGVSHCGSSVSFIPGSGLRENANLNSSDALISLRRGVTWCRPRRNNVETLTGQCIVATVRLPPVSGNQAATHVGVVKRAYEFSTVICSGAAARITEISQSLEYGPTNLALPGTQPKCSPGENTRISRAVIHSRQPLTTTQRRRARRFCRARWSPGQSPG